jgi:hypothetical protein
MVGATARDKSGRPARAPTRAWHFPGMPSNRGSPSPARDLKKGGSKMTRRSDVAHNPWAPVCNCSSCM